MNPIKVFLTQAANTRWYYTAKTFTTWMLTIADGSQVEMLAPKSTTDLSRLPDTAITVALLPKEYNDYQKSDLIALGFSETIMIDPETGQQVSSD
tara:strand:- start:242 stop:526 length:285 start_codon:yes stop_codon:yes gene_type:complete